MLGFSKDFLIGYTFNVFVCVCISLNTCWLCTVLGRKHLAMGRQRDSFCLLYCQRQTTRTKIRTWRFVVFTKRGTNETSKVLLVYQKYSTYW